MEQWIPLRENFALPFLWCQLAVLTVYFRPSVSPLVEVLFWLYTVTDATDAFSFVSESTSLCFRQCFFVEIDIASGCTCLLSCSLLLGSLTIFCFSSVSG